MSAFPLPAHTTFFCLLSSVVPSIIQTPTAALCRPIGLPVACRQAPLPKQPPAHQEFQVPRRERQRRGGTAPPWCAWLALYPEQPFSPVQLQAVSRPGSVGGSRPFFPSAPSQPANHVSRRPLASAQKKQPKQSKDSSSPTRTRLAYRASSLNGPVTSYARACRNPRITALNTCESLPLHPGARTPQTSTKVQHQRPIVPRYNPPSSTVTISLPMVPFASSRLFHLPSPVSGLSHPSRPSAKELNSVRCSH